MAMEKMREIWAHCPSSVEHFGPVSSANRSRTNGKLGAPSHHALFSGLSFSSNMAAALPPSPDPRSDPTAFLKPWIRAFMEEVQSRGLDRIDFQLARFEANRDLRNFTFTQKGCGMRLACARCGSSFKTLLVRSSS